MFLETFKTLAKQEIQQIVCDLSDETGGLEDKEVRKWFAFSISPKTLQLLDASEDIEKEWMLSK